MSHTNQHEYERVKDALKDIQEAARSVPEMATAIERLVRAFSEYDTRLAERLK